MRSALPPTGPEAALTLLIPLGVAGVAYIVPISLGIIILLGIVYFSYRQTIMAYPQGGGSCTVASANLGMWAGLLAAASLMVDYVLTAAVGISAGVGALISAMPSLERHTLALCLVILIVVTLVNLRGVSETGGIFLVPTYLFIFCLLALVSPCQPPCCNHPRCCCHASACCCVRCGCCW
jgi:amino acid transporter